MVSGIRILHCAGFCLDSPSWEGPEEWISQRNHDLWRTFEGVLSLCRSEKVDFLLVAGNLFEQEHIRQETVERVAKSFAQLVGTKIFIAPGARDPLVMTSAYRLAVWPSNVHIYSGGLSKVKASPSVTVYGAGWSSYGQNESFLDGFQAARDGSLQLMLLHTEVNRILPQQIAASGLDYLALGHQGPWCEVQQTGDTYWADCGSVEARSFKETGSHGVLLGEIEKNSVRLEFQELGQRNYLEKTVSVSPDLEGLVRNLLAETSLPERQKDLFRINLAGPRPEVETAIPKLKNMLADEFRYLEVLSLEKGISQLVQEDVNLSVALNKGNGFLTWAEVLVKKIEERLDSAQKIEDQEHWELVQKIGLAALGQGRENDED